MSDYISEDNFLLIFKSLPVKTLLRFRCVCKWWKGLIDSHSFVQDHLAFQKPLFSINYEGVNEFHFDPRTVPFVDNFSGLIRAQSDQNLRLLNTLHGVVCVSAYNSSYMLWNILIRKKLIIPLPKVIDVELYDGDQYPVHTFTLSSFFEWDHDDRPIATFSAFWIDPSTRDFKIVTFKLMRTDEGCDTSFIGIFYSSIIQEWLQVTSEDVIFFNCRPMPGAPPVMVGDVAYWRACVINVMEDYEDEEDEEQEYSKAAIVWFDFLTDDFGYIRVPNMDYSGGEFQPVHCRLQGGLSLVYWDLEYPFRCDIYSKKDDDTWVKMFDLRLSPTAFYVSSLRDEMEDRWRALAIDPQTTLLLYDSNDTKDGSTALRSGIKSPVTYIISDFVQSLLFPCCPHGVTEMRDGSVVVRKP